MESGGILMRRLVVVVLLGGLLFLSWQVLAPFLVPVAWAAILAYVTWPLHRRLMGLMPGWPNLSALLATLLLTLALVLPVIWTIATLRHELTVAYGEVTGRLSQGPLAAPDFVRSLPWLGDWLQGFLDRVSGDREGLRGELARLVEPWLGQVGHLAGGLLRTVAQLGFAVLTVFFFYRDGESLLAQLRQVLARFLGARGEAYLQAVGATSRAVVYGIVLTAVAQGAMAGLGYWGAGLEAPVLLGMLTVLIAMVPFGTPFVWGSIGVWLLLTERVAAGIGLLLWGTLVVSWVDNLVRPMVISSAARIPFLLVMFGVLGGLAAFGAVGLFLGPMILAVLLAVWQEWREEQAESAQRDEPEAT